MKFISGLLMIAVLVFSPPAYSLKIIPEDNSAKPGDEIQVLVKLYQVDRQIDAFGTVFAFNPEALVYQGLSKIELTQDFDFLEGYEYAPGFVKIAGISRIPIPEFSQGVLFGINFKVKDSALPGNYIMSFANDFSESKSSNIYFTHAESSEQKGEINACGIPPHIPGKELGFFIWYTPEDETWHLSWSINNQENMDVLFTDDIEDAFTQPAILKILTPSGEEANSQETSEIRTGWGHAFSGYIESDGDITEFSQYGLEPFDSFQMVGKKKIVFVAMEELINDTLVFKTNGLNLTFELKIDGELLSHKIFIGAMRRNPDSALFSLRKPEISSLYFIKPADVTTVD